jgi:para-nitrobenzyl esterase
MIARLLALGIVIASAGGCTTDTDEDTIPTGVVIDVEGGTVHGIVDGSTRVFRGIPFAAPPVGELRWKAPAGVEAWTDELDASLYGPVCPQPNILGEGYIPGTEEDCLTLNVWTQEPAPTSLLPVMVFIHGGGFTGGSSRGLAAEAEQDATFTGEHIVPKGNVLLVTVNYRLGELGFFSHPDLEGPSGNYGLQDQQASLRWVQENIATFGGDPNNVTIFGESAGGVSVCAHLRAPESQGLFHKAILESGPCALLVRDPAQATQQGEALMTGLGCSDIACMRGKSATEVLEQPTPMGTFWGPVEDGTVLPSGYGIAEVPIITGSNLDEGTLFLFNDYTELTEEDYEAAIAENASLMLIDATDAPTVAAQYPAASYDSPFMALSTAYGHAVFTCPIRRDARAMSPKSSTWLYQVTHPIDHAFADTLGTGHGTELLLVFGTQVGLLGELSDADRPLSDTVIGYWTRFATNGDPNGGGATDWPTFESGESYLDVAGAPSVGNDLLADECDFWDELHQ